MSKKTDRLRDALQTAPAPIVITGHDRADVDSAVSCILMARLLDFWRIPCRIALHEPDRQSRRVLARFQLDAAALAGGTAQDDSLLLVDHHQSARPGRVIACVDHHPTDYPPDYAYTQIEGRGACAVMALDLLREAGADVSPEDERLAVTALYLDTIALKSAKITEQEAAWGESEAARLGLDADWLQREGMGLRDLSLPAQELAMLGKKAYAFGGRRVLSTYVQSDDIAPDKLEEILCVLREELAREGAALWVYLHHNPVRLRTTEYDLYSDGRTEVIRYGFLASRGKDVMPRVERAMREEERA